MTAPDLLALAEEIAGLLDGKAERARLAAIGGGMDPMEAELLDYEFSLAAREVRALASERGK